MSANVTSTFATSDGPPATAWQLQVDRQLRRILASPVFQRATRPGRFLEFVVGRSVHTPEDPLSEAEIASFVYDRGSFDPRLDPIVRVEAARLRKRLKEYYENHGENDPIEIRLPQRGYMPEIFAKADSAAAHEPQGTPTAPPGAMLLAVLPFVNLSDSSEDSRGGAFCLGLTEEVIAAVSDLASIAVVSRTSAFQYEGAAVDLRAVGKALGVSHVLEGSVRQGENLIRVTAKLIDCGSGFTMWSKTLEMELDDDLVLQASLGGMIAETLSEKIGSGPEQQ